MNNCKSNTRGSDMRRLFAFVLMVAFCVAFLSPLASATRWDPNHEPFPECIQTVNTPSGDDGGWNEQESKSGWDVMSLFGCFDIRITAPTLFLYYFDLMDVPDSPDQGNGNDRRSLDHDRRTSPL
jgi:hypothetical protein